MHENSLLKNEKFSFKVEYISANTPVISNMPRPHFHDYYEIYYYLGDEMTYFIENESLIIKKHDLIFVNKYVYHRTFYSMGKSNNRINVTFDYNDLSPYVDSKIINRIEALFKNHRYRCIKHEDLQRINDIFKFMKYYSTAKNNELSFSHCKIMLIDLLMSVVEISEENGFEIEGGEKSESQKRIEHVIEYINDHYDENLSLSFLSEKFFVSKYHLSHLFKSTVGIGITEFINRKRLSQANKLLRYTNKKITEIATLSGFNNMSHFLKQYKNLYKMTPKEYRAKLSGEL